MNQYNNEIWNDDLLGRKKDADFLEKLLVAKSKDKTKAAVSQSYVLAIDQNWGAGKTFFLQRFQKQLENSNYLTCYINAWEDDFSEDPMIPIISAIDEQVTGKSESSPERSASSKNKKRFSEAIKIVGKHIIQGSLKKTVGISIAEISDELTTEEIADEIGKISEQVAHNSSSEILENFRKTRKNLNEFREAFSAVINELSESCVQPPLFILIDELDRCKPTYAIALLERVKHLFSVPGAVFVLTVDKEQLAHSVSAVYGLNFDSARYLNRFFDSTYRFPTPEVTDFIKFQITSREIELNKLAAPFSDEVEPFIVSCVNAYNLSLRDVSQCMNKLKTISSLWEMNFHIELIYLLPLIFSDHVGNRTEFNLLRERKFDAWKAIWHQNSDKYSDFTLEYYEGRHLHREIVSVQFTRTLAEFLSYSRHPLNDLPSSNNRNNGLHNWLRTTFLNEFTKRFAGGYRPDEDLASKILDYPEYVLNARSLSDN